jgi:hypothetical protein
VAVLLFLTSAAFADVCTPGTLTSYLASSPCDFGPATLQITNFSNTFGLSDDQMNVSIVNYGTSSDPHFFFDVQPESGFFVGAGTANVQLQLNFPSSPVGSSGYAMEFYVTTGCCDVGAVAFFDFPGGVVDESIEATTTDCSVFPLCSVVQGTSSYSSTWGSDSATFFDSKNPTFISFFEFSEPSIVIPTPTPEPSSVILLLTTLLSIAIVARKRIARGL